MPHIRYAAPMLAATISFPAKERTEVLDYFYRHGGAFDRLDGPLTFDLLPDAFPFLIRLMVPAPGVP